MRQRWRNSHTGKQMLKLEAFTRNLWPPSEANLRLPRCTFSFPRDNIGRKSPRKQILPYPPFPPPDTISRLGLSLSSHCDRTGRTTTWRGTGPSTATSTRCASTPRSCGCRTCSCTTGRAPSPSGGDTTAGGRAAATVGSPLYYAFTLVLE